MRIGFLGGTGVEAKGLALRLAAAGQAVTLGSRAADRAQAAAEMCNSILGRTLIFGTSNREMLSATELVFLTVPFSQAVAAVEDARPLLSGSHVLVDVTVPMTFRSGHAEYLDRAGESNSEVIARRLPDGVPLAAAFKTIPAAVLSNLEYPLNCDVFVCSDTEEAARIVMNVAGTIPTLRPLYCGPLKMARTIERMTVLAVELNRIHKKRGARYRIEGI